MDRQEAIKVIRSNWPEGRHQLKKALQTLIPEFQENEDEKIRKELISHFRGIRDNYSKDWYGFNINDIISWLEKQGEKIDAIENLDTEFEKQVSHLIASAINKEHEYNEGFVKWTANALLNYAKQELEKQGEQKPVEWSAYDKATLEYIIEDIKELCDNETEEGSIETYNREISLLQAINESIKLSSYTNPAAWSEEDEPQKELAEIYLAVFDEKFPILPTLKGKQLADYKNFLNKCQQILGLKYWSLRPLQAKLFEKLSLLWAAWGAYNLKDICKMPQEELDKMDIIKDN